MSYRIQLLSQFGVSAEAMKSAILELCPDFDSKCFDDPQIFCSNNFGSSLAVTKRSVICDHFSTLAKRSACIWITTNDTDDWHLKILNDSKMLADLHLPLVNVDSDEWCEPNGRDVRDSISCELPDQLSTRIMASDTAAAWPAYFKYAERLIDKSLGFSKIEFDSSKLQMLFLEDSFSDVCRTIGGHLGFFVNEVLNTEIDLSPADDY